MTHNLGSIEGTLEATDGGATFTLWDRVSLAPIRCYFDASQLKEAKALLEKRVLVQGMIHYSRNGVPRSITNIEAIRDHTPDLTLPVAPFGSIPDDEAARDPIGFLRRRRLN